MPALLRLRLAGLRFALLFGIGCFLVLHTGLLARAVREQDAQTAPPVTHADFPFLGITLLPDGLAPAALDRELARLADAGFGWVRVRLAWDAIEPAQDQWTWAAADALLEAIHRAGLEPVVVLDGSPAWARGPAGQTGVTARFAPPADFTTFGDFTAAVATRYRGQVRVYQIWDEPNIAPHWGAQHIEAAGYARLLKVAATAVRAADPTAVILLAALAPTADRGHTAQDEVYFLQRLYAAGAAPYFDAVALQPFGFGTTPFDARQARSVLNLHRALLVRRAMVAAGDGTTPVWLVRTGWNRAAAPPWRTVTPQNQVDFTAAMLDLVDTRWPWVTALGWAAHAPAVAPGDPIHGFALTADLTRVFRAWSQDAARQSRGQAAQAVSWGPPAGQAAGLAAAWAVWGWRTHAAMRLLPWANLRRRYRALPAAVRGILWLVLLGVYWLATWPPLVALCWLAAALLIAAQPVTGLALALTALPFHAQHKEIALLDTVWAVPPAYAALLCMAPTLWLSWRRARCVVLRMTADRWGGLAAGWVVVALLGAWHVWHLPAYMRGLVELAGVPLLLFGLLRAWPHAPRHLPKLAGALWLGGLLLALVGLLGWLRGSGTSADGLLRLTGPTFSPNHAALYLERSLFLGVALGLAAQGRTRQAILAGCGLIVLALLLTGSRGALLLGVPVGLLVMAGLRPGMRQSLRRLPPGLVWLAAGMVAALAWLLAPRLANWSTVAERWEIWWLALALWRDHWAVGLGPGGFYWRFPAYLPVHSTLDPNLRHPHQVWLELAAQGGLLGLAWLAAALAFATRWVWVRRSALTWPQVGLVAGLAAGLAHAQVDAFQALPDLAAWNWAALALLLAWPTQPPNKTPLPQRTAAPG